MSKWNKERLIRLVEIVQLTRSKHLFALLHIPSDWREEFEPRYDQTGKEFDNLNNFSENAFLKLKIQIAANWIGCVFVPMCMFSKEQHGLNLNNKVNQLPKLFPTFSHV